jgi:hypothetical protein
MIHSPDWWKTNCPAQYAIIDPLTLPFSREGLEGLKYQRRLTACWDRAGEVYFVKDGFLPIAESEVLNYEKLWLPYGDEWRSDDWLSNDWPL